MSTSPAQMLSALVADAVAPMALIGASGELIACSSGWQPEHAEVHHQHRAALASPTGPPTPALSWTLGRRRVELACLRVLPSASEGPAPHYLLLGRVDTSIAPRQRFLALIEALPFAVGVHRDFHFLHVNRQAVDYLGYGSPADLIGKPIITIIPPHEIAAVKGRVATMMRTGEPAPERATQLQRADGTLVTAELSAFVVQDFDGMPAYVVVARDVTERHVYERRLQQVQRMEAVGRLAGGIAHDFNNVLSVILSYAAVLTDTLEDGSAAGIAASEIREAAVRATAMTRRLLTISQGRNEHVNGVTPTLLGPVVQGLLSLLRRLCGKEVRLAVNGTAARLCVPTGPSPVEQILLNLVINARDAMPSGGHITIHLDRAETAPRPTPECSGPFVIITVIDDGRGMSEAVRERAFEPFFSTKSPSEGTGLGLSTVFGIARQAGGGACIESAPDAGTTVTVWLPECDPDEAAELMETATATAEVSPTRAASLWVVEDDPAIRVMVGRLLRNAGYQSQEFASGEDALTFLRSDRFEQAEGLEPSKAGARPTPDLLITDVIMDGCQGPELALAVRLSLPRLPVLFMSGYTEDTLDARHLGGGPTRFLGKPFTPKDLLDAVQALLVSGAGC